MVRACRAVGMEVAPMVSMAQECVHATPSGPARRTARAVQQGNTGLRAMGPALAIGTDLSVGNTVPVQMDAVAQGSANVSQGTTGERKREPVMPAPQTASAAAVHRARVQGVSSVEGTGNARRTSTAPVRASVTLGSEGLHACGTAAPTMVQRVVEGRVPLREVVSAKPALLSIQRQVSVINVSRVSMAPSAPLRASTASMAFATHTALASAVLGIGGWHAKTSVSARLRIPAAVTVHVILRRACVNAKDTTLGRRATDAPLVGLPRSAPSLVQSTTTHFLFVAVEARASTVSATRARQPTKSWPPFLLCVAPRANRPTLPVDPVAQIGACGDPPVGVCAPCQPGARRAAVATASAAAMALVCVSTDTAAATARPSVLLTTGSHAVVTACVEKDSASASQDIGARLARTFVRAAPPHRATIVAGVTVKQGFVNVNTDTEDINVTNCALEGTDRACIEVSV